MKRNFIMYLVIIFSLITNPAIANVIEKQQVRTQGLVGDLYFSTKFKTHKPLIAVGGAGGGQLFWRNPEKGFHYLLDEGYAVLSLAYFNRKGMHGLPKQLKRIPLEYFETAMQWLLNQPTINAEDGMTLFGHSRGAELVLLLASKYEQVNTVVASAPSAYIQGLEADYPEDWFAELKRDPCGPAWMYKGLPVRGICNADISGNDPWYKIMLDEKLVEQHMIPIESITASVLLITGVDDKTAPYDLTAKRMIKRFKQVHHPYLYKHVELKAGHNVYQIAGDEILSFLNATR